MMRVVGLGKKNSYQRNSEREKGKKCHLKIGGGGGLCSDERAKGRRGARNSSPLFLPNKMYNSKRERERIATERNRTRAQRKHRNLLATAAGPLFALWSKRRSKEEKGKKNAPTHSLTSSRKKKKKPSSENPSRSTLLTKTRHELPQPLSTCVRPLVVAPGDGIRLGGTTTARTKDNEAGKKGQKKKRSRQGRAPWLLSRAPLAVHPNSRFARGCRGGSNDMIPAG